MATPAFQKLNAAEIDLIKASWTVPAGDLQGTGEAIFYSYLKKYPAHQDQFETLKGQNIEDAKASASFKSIAGRIIDVFDRVVKSLEPEMKDAAKIVAEVGKSHQSKPVPKTAYVELRGVLVDILVAACKLDGASAAAWNKLLDSFYFVMFECLDGRASQF